MNFVYSLLDWSEFLLFITFALLRSFWRQVGLFYFNVWFVSGYFLIYFSDLMNIAIDNLHRNQEMSCQALNHSCYQCTSLNYCYYCQSSLRCIHIPINNTLWHSAMNTCDDLSWYTGQCLLPNKILVIILPCIAVISFLLIGSVYLFFCHRKGNDRYKIFNYRRNRGYMPLAVQYSRQKLMNKIKNKYGKARKYWLFNVIDKLLSKTMGFWWSASVCIKLGILKRLEIFAHPHQRYIDLHNFQ